MASPVLEVRGLTKHFAVGSRLLGAGGALVKAVEGRDIATLAGGELMTYRRAVQVVFQDPFSSLSPRMRVRDIIAEPLEIHTRLRPAAIRERVDAVLQLVGLAPDVASLFPHEF